MKTKAVKSKQKDARKLLKDGKVAKKMVRSLALNTKGTATQPAPVVIDQGEYKILDIKKIFADKNNYRKAYSRKGMDELTASIKTKGVLQPILVRPNGGKDSFLIVAGHRRYQGALDAGLKQIPSIVRNLSDADALELQVIENDQREDPNPMEQAWGYKRLIDLGKHTTETLAAKLGKSVDYILGRISLLKLPEDAQKKVASEEISLGHALLLTRLRHPSEQKEFLKMLSDRDGCITVREAQRQMRDFSRDIKDAVFDLEGCKKCSFLGRNQSILFPELKNSGECMDRGCFFAKTRDHYQTSIAAAKNAGFKIITKEQEVNKLRGYGSGTKTSVEIYPPGSKDKGDVTPKRYKSDCAACTDHHAFYLYETKNWQGKQVKFGEICLNRKCFDKMNNVPGRGNGKSGKKDSGTSIYTTEAHARDCRNRFLRAELPARVQASDNLQRRLLIYNVLAQHKEWPGRTELIKTYRPEYKANRYENDETAYRIAMSIRPNEHLSNALTDILLGSIQATMPSVLLMMAEEAKLDMTKDFGVDETFLKSKTKEELIAFARTFDLQDNGLKTMTSNSKKGELVKAILAHDLKGKLPKECVTVCSVKEEIEEDEEDDSEGEGYDPCRGCSVGDFETCEDDDCPVNNGEKRTCRICSCQEDSPCAGGCAWVEKDLCSACAEKAEALKEG